MNTRKDRILETLLILGLPLAIGAGCAADGNKLESSKLAFMQGQELSEAVDGVGQQVLQLQWDKLPFVETSPAGNAQTISSDPVVGVESSTDAMSVQEAEMSPMETVIQLMVADAPIMNEQAMEDVQPDLVPEKQMFFFPLGSYQIAAGDIEALREHATILQNNPNLRVTVIGHTDSQGSKAFNAKLSEKRAQAIVELLTTFGVPEAQLMTSSYGASVPLQDVAKYEENRRVELKYDDVIRLSTSE